MKKPIQKNPPLYTAIGEIPEPLAKTVLQKDGSRKKGVTLVEHSRIVGETARELILRKPSWLQAALFPCGSELLAAVHDIGKLSPGFQEKIHRSLGISLDLEIPPDWDTIVGGHATVSQAALCRMPHFVAEIAGRHHGYSPVDIGFPGDEKYGGAVWQKERSALIESLREEFQADWPVIRSAEQADLLTGLVTVADWIGSGSVFDFPSADRGTEVRKALDQAGFVTPTIRQNLSFEDVFHCSPYPLQQLFFDTVQSPGVYVLEAPMGFGKTEAALYAAYKILAIGQATGIYFALPTQLTSEKIWERMVGFLGAILESDSPFRNVLLLHSHAWLQKTELGEEGQPGGSWFDGKKRGLLAPFAVGTLDQALMAVMNVKHGFVRTFGLAGKVVILDEVHSYDSYTGTLLDHLVGALERLHCTVIILSATLTIGRKNVLLSVKEPSETGTMETDAYPLVTARPREKNLLSIPGGQGENKTVALRMLYQDRDAVEEALNRAEEGQQVLWIENTVDEAQNRLEQLGSRAAERKISCGLIHSRFLKTDREEREGVWVGLYGKSGTDLRVKSGHILIGTQVLEQSLDIDADFLVTRLAPTDMLLQRIGRLWRHRTNDPVRPVDAAREAWILAPIFEDAVNDRSAFGKTSLVYAPYVLVRTLAVWQKLSSITLPVQIRNVLEATYQERTETGNMARYRQELEGKKETLRRLALLGTSRGGKTMPESKATTRYSELESASLLLIRSHRTCREGVEVRFLDGSSTLLPRNIRSVSDLEWRRKAACLYKNTVSVPDYLAPETSRHTLQWLEGYMYLGAGDETLVQAALVDADGTLRGLDSSPEPLANYYLEYNNTLGYRARRKL